MLLSSWKWFCSISHSFNYWPFLNNVLLIVYKGGRSFQILIYLQLFYWQGKGYESSQNAASIFLWNGVSSSSEDANV